MVEKVVIRSSFTELSLFSCIVFMLLILRKYLKDRINELESNSENNNIRDLYRGINEFKKGYQPRTNW
jgi:hypothetical protein